MVNFKEVPIERLRVILKYLLKKDILKSASISKLWLCYGILMKRSTLPTSAAMGR